MATTEVRETRRVLLLCNAERGQANVFLATTHSLLELGAEVHFASFASLQKEVEETHPTAKFHLVKGPDMKECWGTAGVEEIAKGADWRPPNVWNMSKYIKLCLLSLFPWSGPQFMEIFRSVNDIIDELKPDMAVIDPSFSPALTACKARRQRFIVLAPNTIKEFAMFAQSWSDIFFRYPCLPSGLPFPIPWYQAPLNAWYVLVSIFLAIFDMHRLRTEQHVREQTGSRAHNFVVGLHNLGASPPPGVKLLVANRRELEYPLKKIPSHIIACGPMISPAPSVEESDPELARWLARAPTLYINMGTHFQTSLPGIKAIMGGLRIAIDNIAAQRDAGGPVTRLQVLWKLKGLDFTPAEQAEVNALLGDELAKDTVRVVEWLKPAPLSVLAHPNVVGFVNHGGANSFLEGVAAGRPQVVIPAWMDCFDFACRVELLGLGVWGNKRTTGYMLPWDLGAALTEILIGPRAQAIRDRTAELARLCNRVPGRVIAAKTILAETQVRMAAEQAEL